MTTLTRRGAFTGALASIAVVGATAAAVAAPSTSPTPAGVSPELSALMAAYDAAGRAYERHEADTVEPLEADAAVRAAALPHTFMRIDGRDQSTANSDSINLAFVLTRDVTAKEKRIYFYQQWRSLLAAHKRRERTKRRILRSPAIVAAIKRQDDLSGVWADAMGAVCHYPAGTAADLHAKLAFMVKHRMFEGVDWGDVLLADAARLTKMEG